MPETNTVDNPLTTGAQPRGVLTNNLCATPACRRVARLVQPRPQGQVQIGRSPKHPANI